MIEIKSNRIITPDGLFDGYVYIDKEKIDCVTAKRKTADEKYDFTDLFVSAGFIDIHTHGGGGFPFVNGTKEDVVRGANVHLRHGTTSIVPTVSAAPFPIMKKAVANIAAAMKDENSKSNILGAHLEGPYLSAAQCGAQCPDFITEPIEKDYKGLIEKYGEFISRWTYAPEKDVDGAFCKYLTSHGIIASAGHTDARYDDMKTAIDNGCNLITHLYSCTSTVTRDHGFRSLGVIESAFLRDELYVEIIADGKHLPPELIEMIVKIKGIDKVVAVTDSLEIADTDIKTGVMSGTPFMVEDGVCKLKDRSAFAGSIATADKLVRVLVKDCGYDVASAVKTVTSVPAEILKLDKGELSRGKDADVIVFDEDINVKSVFVGGEKVRV